MTPCLLPSTQSPLGRSLLTRKAKAFLTELATLQVYTLKVSG